MTIQQFLTFDFSPLVWALAGTALLCGILIICLFIPRIRRVANKANHDDEAPIPTDGYPSVSVIVYSQGDGWNLRNLLVQILEQDYPAPMEVIVVNDENADSTEDVVSELELKYRNLYMTFAPEQSRNLSRKKLSITLGLKAARYDNVILTCGNCNIPSPLWLRLMMRHFIDGKEIVIGHSTLRPTEDAKILQLSRTASFDAQWSATRALSAAIAGHPFMGDACNIAYSRRLFFENKGFSKTLNLIYGDDDIFINEITDRHNTAVELSPDSRVESLDPNIRYIHTVLKQRRLFTSTFLPRSPYLMMGLISVLSWCMLLSAIAASLLALPSLIIAAAMLILLPAICIPVMISWRRTARALGLRPLFTTQPFLTLWHPIYNLRYRLQHRRTRNENYTWSQKI